MTLPANTQTTLPVYVQIADVLMRDIASGRLIDGERLAPEREMAVQFDTSVGTLRKALAILVEKGLLNRVQGSGNYVRAQGLRDTVYAMFRLELPSGGGVPRAEILSVETRSKPDDLLRFGDASGGTCIRRLRRLDETMIAVEEIWLCESAGRLTHDQVGDSLYRTYQDRLNLRISHAEDRVGVGQIPAWAPAKFGLAAGATSGFIERLSWSSSGVTVEYSRTWFDPTRAVYVQRIK